MRKQVYIFSFSALSFFSAFSTNLRIADRNVHPTSEVGKVKLFHNNKEGFRLYKDGVKHIVPKHSLTPELRSITSAKLAAYQKHAYLKVNKQSDGEYSISSHVRGLGGGAGGATAGVWAGKLLTHLVFQGGIAIVSCAVGVFNPPAGLAVAVALEKTLAPIEIAVATSVAVGAGIVGAVATGPV